MTIIDAFEGKHFPPAEIKRNEETKSEWDLDESHGFVCPSSNPAMDQLTARFLDALQHYVYTLKKALCADPHQDFGICHNEAILFVVTPCTLQEIPKKNNHYDGMNKPKDIVTHPYPKRIDALQFAKDNDYRASRRHILLRVRTKHNQLRDWNTIKSLLVHELAHTFCNHVTFRTAGNHADDFKKCESFVKQLTNSPVVKQVENDIIHTFY
jgi:hypothetical protein